jgi:hypothetical protein
MPVIVVHLLFIGLIFGLPFGLIRLLHQRYQVAYPLLIVGVITFSLSLFIRTGVLWVLGGTLLNSPLIGATLIGVVVGFMDVGVRAFGYARLARSTVYRPQTVMIGIGHALPEIIFIGVWTLWGTAGLAKQDSSAIDLSVLDGNALAEMISAITPLSLHITLAWLVLQTFLRGEVGWIFEAIIWEAIVIGTVALFSKGSTEPEIIIGIWWVLVSIINGVIFWRVKPPEKFKWQPARAIENFENQDSTVT